MKIKALKTIKSVWVVISLEKSRFEPAPGHEKTCKEAIFHCIAAAAAKKRMCSTGWTMMLRRFQALAVNVMARSRAEPTMKLVSSCPCSLLCVALLLFLFFVSNMNISFLILSLNASQLAKKKKAEIIERFSVSFNFILYTHFHSDLGGPTLWFRCLLLSSASLLFLPAREGIDKQKTQYINF